MKNLFETRYAKEIFELKPNLPKSGITCEHYITDNRTKKSFYYWIGEFEELQDAGHVFSTSDKYISNSFEIAFKILDLRIRSNSVMHFLFSK